MEGDYQPPKLQESELPSFEEQLPAPEFIEEASPESPLAKPTLVGSVATEALKNNPNPELRKLVSEAYYEQGHEVKKDPAVQQNNSHAVTGLSPEPIVTILPVSEDQLSTRTAEQELRVQAQQPLFREQPPVSLYKQAIVVGITTAVAILAILITVKLT